MGFVVIIFLVLSGCSYTYTHSAMQHTKPIDIDLNGRIMLFGQVSEIPTKPHQSYFFDREIKFKNCFQVEGLKDCLAAQFGSNVPDTLEILGRVENPVWFATDSYFIDRSLPIPPIGSKHRFLKEVLGKEAFYLSAGFTLAFCNFDVKDPSVICLKDPKTWEELSRELQPRLSLTFYK